MIRYTIEKHAAAFPSKVLAREGGKHIYNVKLTEETDNGNFIARGDYLSLDLYKQAVAKKFEGVVREQAPNGNYYVEVTDPGDALLVYQVPMIEEEYNDSFNRESNFFNVKDDVVRCYELAVGDIIELSEAAFTANPTVGATVALSGKKLA